MIVVGIIWFAGLVIGLNIVYVLRDKTRWARTAADFLRRFAVRPEDGALLVWVIVGDALLLLMIVGAMIRELSSR